MNHTPQIKAAIRFAAEKHRAQVRLGAERTPYIAHLVSVALLVAEDGAEDDVVTAALLHDTLEDTDTTRAELVERFNERVAELVEDVTEDKALSWEERRARYLEHLEHAASDDALLIAIADKIDNIEDKLETIEREGPAFLSGFSRDPAAYVRFNAEALRIAEARLPEHRLTKRLGEAHAREQEALK
ncbi:MAG: bifunctional (p)ppGpp synthetase/guanosine-3',5'-bis(diphosphate) 3'-pyrophosphohydrolase [Patescibacteria group bacterium]|nr:HD domain-containing protein [Patescibacteria group bacterium]MDE2057433.1 bifunctional (p)ppGpp synthetase/guanosine-3',5'-bis(diphosphate) 3'-pyrophosphohydrolase [Patescibacteria group bacterium]